MNFVFLSCHSRLILLISWFDKVERSAISLAKISCLLSHKLSLEFYYIIIFVLRVANFQLNYLNLYQASAYFDFHSPFLTRAVNSVLLLKEDTKFNLVRLLENVHLLQRLLTPDIIQVIREPLFFLF